jgi:hypothetical protein
MCERGQLLNTCGPPEHTTQLQCCDLTSLRPVANVSPQDLFDLVYGLTRITPAPPPTPVTGARPRYLTMCLHAVNPAPVGWWLCGWGSAAYLCYATLPAVAGGTCRGSVTLLSYATRVVHHLQQGRRQRATQRGPWPSSRPRAAAWRLDDTPVQVVGWMSRR